MNGTERNKLPPMIKIEGLTKEAYKMILLRKAEEDSGRRRRRIGEIAGMVLNEIAEGKQ